MMLILAILVLAGFQDPEIDELIRRLEKSSADKREQNVEALVAKGEAAEAAVRRRLESAPDAMRGRFEAVLRRLDLQRKLRETFPTPTPIDFDAVDRPIKELLPEVEKWLGLPVATERVPERNVTLHLKGASPMEALDAFHAATGLTWSLDKDRTYDSEKGIHIHLLPKALLVARPRSTWPASSSGRYRISAASVMMEQRPASQGSGVASQVGISIEYPYSTRPNNLSSFTVGRIVDDKGRELALIPDRFVLPHGYPQLGRGAPPVALARTIQFQTPAGDARSISILGGKGRAAFVVERTYLTFEDPIKKVGTSVEAFGSTVTLKEFHDAHGWMRLILDQSGPADSRKTPVETFEYRGSSLVEFVEVVHADGRITYPESQGAGSEEGVYYRRRMMCFSTPDVKAIRLAVRSFVAYEDFTFELRDIPLPGTR